MLSSSVLVEFVFWGAVTACVLLGANAKDKGKHRLVKIAHSILMMWFIPYHALYLSAIWSALTRWSQVMDIVGRSSALFPRWANIAVWLCALLSGALAVAVGFPVAKRNDLARRILLWLLCVLWVVDGLDIVRGVLEHPVDARAYGPIFAIAFIVSALPCLLMLIFYSLPTIRSALYRDAACCESEMSTGSTHPGAPRGCERDH